MKITEQTLRELLVNPHSIKELINEPPHMAQRRADIAKLYEGVKPYDEAEVKASTVAAEVMLHQTKLSHQASSAFHAHLDVCEQCRNHCFQLCSMGHSLLIAAAMSYTDSRVN